MPDVSRVDASRSMESEEIELTDTKTKVLLGVSCWMAFLQ